MIDPTNLPVETHQVLDLEAAASASLEAHLGRELHPPAPVINWAPYIPQMFDDIKRLPVAEARLLETGMTKFPNLAVIRLGLRYQPGEGDQERRAVTISGLPPLTTLDQVLHSVRGGEVLSATMCDTVSITGSLTALVTFANSKGAARFCSIVQDEGFYIGFHEVEVKLIGLPTYPMRRILQDRVLNRGRTRALTIRSTDRSIKKTIYKILSTSFVATHIEGFKDHHNPDEVSLLFYSVEMAMWGFKLLQDCPGSTKVWFGNDPCARDSLKDATPPN